MGLIQFQTDVRGLPSAPMRLAAWAASPGSMVLTAAEAYGGALSLRGYSAPLATPRGVGTHFQGDPLEGNLFVSNAALSVVDFTVFAYVSFTALGTTGAPIDSDRGSYRCFQFQKTPTNKFSTIGFNTAGTPYLVETVGTIGLNTPTLMVARWRGLQIDNFLGGEKASVTMTGTPKPFNGYLGIGATFAGTGATWPALSDLTGTILHTGVITRAVSDGIIWQWIRNPLLLWKRTTNVVPFASAAPTVPTLSDLQAVSITSTTVQGTYDYAF